MGCSVRIFIWFECLLQLIYFIWSSIRPDLPLSFIQEELAFNSKDEMLSFLKERNAVLLPDGSLDCKASQSNFRQYEESLG